MQDLAIIDRHGQVIYNEPEQLGLQEMYRLAELGRLSATLLHEISNPLTAALLHMEQVSDQQSTNVRQARRSIQLLCKYVEAARQQVKLESTLTDFALQAQIAQLKRIVMPLARRARVKLIIEAVPKCRLYGDPVKFQQILANLIVNAIEAYGSKPTKLARNVCVKLVSSEHCLTIEVRDWGQGIAPSQLKYLFKPFYTTKSQAGHGLGIGLAIVHQYVTKDFGGSITVSSTARKGTSFKIELPAFFRPIVA